MIYLFLAEGFEEIEALTPVDVLRRAGLKLKTVAVGDSITVKGAHGIEVKADIHESELGDETPEAIILPGGMPGADNLRKHNGVKSALLELNARNGYIAAICASPAVVLGSFGLLESRKATTYPGTGNIEDGAIYLEDGLVVDGNLITAKAPGFTSDFAFKIVEALKGIDAVNAVKRAMCLM